MPQTEVLITFYSRCGSTEKLAHAAAVGAVQARSQIRFRRLPDVGSSTVDAPECRKALERMRREYIAPGEADVLRADVIIFVAPTGFRAVDPQWTTYLDLIQDLRSAGKLEGKVAAAIQNDTNADELAALVLRLGFIVVPTGATADSTARALAHGRRATEVAKALNGGKNG